MKMTIAIFRFDTCNLVRGYQRFGGIIASIVKASTYHSTVIHQTEAGNKKINLSVSYRKCIEVWGIQAMGLYKRCWGKATPVLDFFTGRWNLLTPRFYRVTSSTVQIGYLVIGTNLDIRAIRTFQWYCRESNPGRPVSRKYIYGRNNASHMQDFI